MIGCKKFKIGETEFHISRFQNGTQADYHVQFDIRYDNLNLVSSAAISLRKLLLELGLDWDHMFIARMHIKNLNLAGIIRKVIFEEALTSVSVICQPPANGAEISFWLWFKFSENIFTERSPEYTRLTSGAQEWIAFLNITSEGGSVEEQTSKVFNCLSDWMKDLSVIPVNNLLRTWIFMGNLLNDYNPMCATRAICLNNFGFSKETNYITSTGIQGKSFVPDAKLQMDAIAVKGSQNFIYIKAPDFLNSTTEYGVTFERGTLVTLEDDYRIIFLSGTASINNKGEVVAVDDIESQSHRVLDNIEALLNSGGGNITDSMSAIVYIKYQKDYDTVNNIVEKRLRNIPCIYLLADVCRSEWLVEIELIACLSN